MEGDGKALSPAKLLPVRADGAALNELMVQFSRRQLPEATSRAHVFSP